MSPARSMSGEPRVASRIAALPGTSSEDPEHRPNNIIPIAHLEAGQPCARGARTIPGSTPPPSHCRTIPRGVVIPMARRRRIPGRIATSTRPRRTDPPPAKSSSCSSVNPCASRNCPRGHESSTPGYVKRAELTEGDARDGGERAGRSSGPTPASRQDPRPRQGQGIERVQVSLFLTLVRAISV